MYDLRFIVSYFGEHEKIKANQLCHKIMTELFFFNICCYLIDILIKPFLHFAFLPVAVFNFFNYING